MAGELEQPESDGPGLATGVLAPLLASLSIRCLRATMRIRHEGREGLEALEAAGRNYILAFWHGRLLMMPYAYRGRRMAIMISRHKDGELIARTMRRFGHAAIRGSTTRGGAEALRAVVRKLHSGWDVGITPDGPRGPRFQVQSGVIQAARLGGVPIVPVAFAARPARTFASWDRFMLPWPFARATFIYGRPLAVPRRAGAEEMERLRAALEKEMQAMTERAERDCGRLSAP
jgi:lysophospholipid acyltransferase (LPLAT)-like uncharacterized protein